MTRQARSWAPPSIAESPALRAKVAEAVSDWSFAWFARFRLTVGRWDIVRGDPWTGVEGVRVEGQALGLARGERAAQRLHERAFGVDLSATPLSEADRRVVDGFAREMFDDLLAGLERALSLGDFRPEAAATWDGGIKIGLTDDSGAVLVWLVAPLAAVLPICRSALAPPRPRAPPLGRRAALAAAAVRLDVILGSADLTIGELRTLAPGDVLVLDRGLHDPVALVIPGSERPFLNAHMKPADDHTTLSLLPA
ncbi:FliM/FliN family flagellar motor C-terminal domain-containing protein [Caulobacter sp. DWR1-3-2b1]|uniref:FliM/FliN family flagellar motor switch protein n=1 Tax=Caulobacter sp. DWR1-3-2b1 TaxID=2804670 RepID=UPI003CEC3F89